MHDFFLAPILSLFSLNFYRRLVSSVKRRGAVYLLYLSFLLSLAVLASFRLQFLPVANQFVGWLGDRLPEMTFTRQGLQMSIKEPLLLSHPKLGPLIYLDPAGDFPKPGDLEKAVVVLTRTTVAYRDPRTKETRIRSVVPKATEKEWRDLKVTGDKVVSSWFKIEPVIASVVFIVFFLGAYLWKLTGAIAYSLIGLLLNRFRRERLPYRSVLNLTFYALSPVTLLECLSFLIPGLRLPLNLWVSLVVTSLYLVFALLAAQPRDSQTQTLPMI